MSTTIFRTKASWFQKWIINRVIALFLKIDNDNPHYETEPFTTIWCDTQGRRLGKIGTWRLSFRFIADEEEVNK